MALLSEFPIAGPSGDGTGDMLRQIYDPTGQMRDIFGALASKADLVGGQVPYAQIPHLANNVTLYVDAATGDDANDGTQGKPFKTIQAAINSLPQLLMGAVIISVAAGTYEEDVSFYGFAGGRNAFMGISLQGAGQNQTFIKGMLITQTTIPVWFSNFYISKGNPSGMCGTYFNTAIFENVTFDGENSASSGLIACLSATGGQVYLANCTFKNAPNYAVLCGGFLTAYNLKGTNNKIGIRVGISPGIGGIAIVDSLPEGFATTKYQKVYGNSIIFEGGVQV